MIDDLERSSAVLGRAISVRSSSLATQSRTWQEEGEDRDEEHRLDHGLDGSNWAQACRMRWVRQQDSSGCGVACLAMVSGLSYAQVREAFIREGLGETRPRRKAFSSNFRELLQVAQRLGLDGRMQRWSSWSSVEGPCILKVAVRGSNWHWVAAERSAQLGLVVLDPDLDLPAFERPPLDVPYCRPESHKPGGNWITFVLN